MTETNPEYESPNVWPLPPETPPDKYFQIAFFKTIEHEAGYVNDPDDPGGETKFGISKRSYPEIDIKNLGRKKARPIYLRDFWRKPRFNELATIAPDLAIKCFDLAVNCGTRTAIKMLQRAINTVCFLEMPTCRAAKWRQLLAEIISGNPVRVDGIIGPITMQAIMSCPHDRALMAALKGEAYNHYRRLNPLYIPGWLNRLES